jgi:hypothetical protein
MNAEDVVKNPIGYTEINLGNLWLSKPVYGVDEDKVTAQLAKNTPFDMRQTDLQKTDLIKFIKSI